MSMSAKIVKGRNADTESQMHRVRPFSLRELGSPDAQPIGVKEFAYPSLNSFACGTAVNSFGEVDLTIGFDRESARGEASRIIAQAESEREMIERAAYEKATAEAMATIDARVAETAAAEIGSMREQLSHSIAAIGETLEEISRRAEADVVELALALAKKIIHREAAADREIVMNVAKAALSRLHTRSTVGVRLHPDDHEYLILHQDKLGYRGSIELVADPSVAPGGCFVHTDSGDVDATIDSQLEEIAEALRAPTSEIMDEDPAVSMTEGVEAQ